MQEEPLSLYEKAVQQQKETKDSLSKLTEDVSKLTQENQRVRHGLETMAGEVEASSDLQNRYTFFRCVRKLDLVVPRQSQAYTRCTSPTLVLYCDVCLMDLVAQIDALLGASAHFRPHVVPTDGEEIQSRSCSRLFMGGFRISLEGFTFYN